MKKLLVIDNYDSFTYNLVAMFKAQPGLSVDVLRNDQASIEEIGTYDALAFSPGPGIPEEAGALLEIISTFSSSKPMLGVCLGLQAIGQAFGAKLYNLKEVFHGVQSAIHIKDKSSLFGGLPDSIEVGRYHSWAISPETLPDELAVTACDDHGMIMGISHIHLPVHGVQFHPESVMTSTGDLMIKNFLKSIS